MFGVQKVCIMDDTVNQKICKILNEKYGTGRQTDMQTRLIMGPMLL